MKMEYPKSVLYYYLKEENFIKRGASGFTLDYQVGVYQSPSGSEFVKLVSLDLNFTSGISTATAFKPHSCRSRHLSNEVREKRPCDKPLLLADPPDVHPWSCRKWIAGITTELLYLSSDGTEGPRVVFRACEVNMNRTHRIIELHTLIEPEPCEFCQLTV